MSTRVLNKSDQYLPIYLESLQIDSILDFDLYIKKGFEFVLYRATRLPFTTKTQQSLLDNNIDRLYISIEKQQEYQKHIEENINQIIESDSINEVAKAGIVYECAKHLVKDVLNNPSLGKNIKRSQAFVESTVSYLLNGENTFRNMLRVMSFDYYTYTHSVNVCTFSLALAQFTGINDGDELNRIGTGALLHDVGKTRISESILNKRGRLSSDEMDIVKNHPQWGLEILRKSDLISADSYYSVGQHHERLNGSGYPKGLSNEDIHLYSRIVMIADVFDAMTTRRAYKNAMETFSAFQEMYELEDGFDRKLLKQFTMLMGPQKSFY